MLLFGVCVGLSGLRLLDIKDRSRLGRGCLLWDCRLAISSSSCAPTGSSGIGTDSGSDILRDVIGGRSVQTL